MKRIRSRVLTAAALSVAALGGAFITAATPASAAGSCAGAGWLCFYDYDTSQYGNVAGDNADWRAFGWNDRAEWFYNQGNYCNVTVYEHINRGGIGIGLDRGYSYLVTDGSGYGIVSSNYWCEY
jgi:hypothetical protein